MQDISVSVIVPVFNVEKYINQCLDSLLGQELNSLEIVVVNDGSTDRTSEIVGEYSRVHDAIRLISQKNQGLSAARNVGMSVARGEYLGFVDGDDWVHESMYRAALDRAIDSNADIVITNGQLYNEGTGELSPIQDFRVWDSLKARNSDLIFSPSAEPDLFMLDTSACKRLYKKRFLQSLDFQFPPGKIFEDVSTHYKLLLNTELVALLDEQFYFYRTNRPGRITAKSDESLFNIFDVMDQVIEDLNRKDADIVIWANYIWFQNWVLRWLRDQISSNFSIEFDRRCFQISKKFKQGSLNLFKEKFIDDRLAIDFVTKQVNNTLCRAEKPGDEMQRKMSDRTTLHLGNDPEGLFSADPHTFMPDVWGWVCMQYNIHSVLDIGCGMGTNLAWFDEYGYEVLGVEGHPNAVAASLVPGRIIQHDFSKGPWSPERKIDLCICTEFAEHVETEFEQNWMVAVDQCKFLLLAAAPPGQGGYHHVNEQPDEYWIDRFKLRGFVQDVEITEMLRATCARKPAPWGRNTLMFFQNCKNSTQLNGIPQRDLRNPRTLQRGENGLELKLEKLQLQNKALNNQLIAVRSSGSWKITAPLRWLLGIVKGEGSRK
jgi:glycosyltransferase involved in cell wall biosynthesis